MADRETVLTNEVYESVIGNLVSDVIKLKKEQGEIITKISIEKETLKLLNDQLKQIKKDIKKSKRTLSKEKRELGIVNNTLNERNHLITDLNYSYITEEERTIDLNEFSIEQPKRR